MELHARLIHAEAGLRVVEVRASRGQHSLGSALAEAPTAQEAEDLAITRLLRRLQGLNDPEPRSAGSTADPLPLESATAAEIGPVSDWRAPVPRPATTHCDRVEPVVPEQNQAIVAPPRQVQPSPPGGGAGDLILASSAASPTEMTVAAQPQRMSPDRQTLPLDAPDPVDEGPADLRSDPHEEPPPDPEDWSQELTAIDLQLRRLSWNREQEGTYLARAFGHASRSRLTRYSDLRAYLMALEALESGSDPALAAVPLRRSELLAQGDALLAQLGWTADQGRAFLERELKRISRQQLSDAQLLQFNMLLEGELMAAGSHT